MRKFKSILCLALALVMIFALCACGGGKTEPKGEEKQEYTEKYNIVYATTDPANSLLDTMLITPLKEDLAKFSNNRIELEVYYSGSLAGQGGVLTAIDAGSCDGGADAPSMYTGVYLYTELINTPGIYYGDQRNYTKVMNEYCEVFPDKGLADKYVNFSHYSAGTFGFNTTSKAVEKAADAKGLSFRATGNVIPYCEALGATGTFIPITDLYESLRLNIVDGAITTLEAVDIYAYFEVCNYFTPTPWFFGDHLELLSRAFYDKLDPEAKEAVDKAADSMMEHAYEYMDFTTENCRKHCEEGNANFRFIDVADADIAGFTDAAADILQAKVDELNAAGLDGDGAVEWLKANSLKYFNK